MPALSAERIQVGDTWEAINDLFEERQWTDGLPIVAPTPARVQVMLNASPRAPEDVVARIPPYWADATIEKIAINAVMAGCRPEYLDVVLAAIEAIGEPQFNLYGVQATTHPAAPLLIVNGPVARELNINSGPNVYGQGWRANATIGRAVRLVLMNIGGGRPELTDKSTQGQPAKYTYCIAENEGANPWQSLSVDRGFSPGDSTVTVVGAAGPQNIADLFSKDAAGILRMIGNSSRSAGGNNFLLGGEPVYALCPEHAAILHQHGFDKAAIRQRLWDVACLPLSDFSPENAATIRSERSALFGEAGPDTMVHIADRPEDIMIVVAGGPGGHSSLIATFGHTRAVTKRIGAA